MWQQYVNLVLGLLIAVLAYAGVSVGWIVVGGVLVAILALWGALGATGMAGSRSAHAQ